MSKSKEFLEQGQALLVQRHQLAQAEQHLDATNTALDAVEAHLRTNDAILTALIADAEQAAAVERVTLVTDSTDCLLVEVTGRAKLSNAPELPTALGGVDLVPLDEAADWQSYRQRIAEYRDRNSLLMPVDPYCELMSASQRISLERRIKEEFSLKSAHCDSYDYMIAGTCGIVGGLIDVLFVGMPGTGGLTRFTDDMTDSAVRKFASFCGWKGPRDDSDPTKSAIGFLERRFVVNYDQPHGAAAGNLFKMSASNHHIKNLAHSPDLIGLFFSILDQFTSTSHFIAGGRLLSIDTQTFELSGNGLAGKVFAGFCNWLGHLFSDMAGSSGAVGRGSGIPIPFFSMLQLVNIGEFGQHRQTFATTAVRVFEDGYDLRHGMALAIPVLVTELLTRLMWTVKQRFFHERPWCECLPSANRPELRRMLLVAHGSLCLIDTTDAALRSGGNMVQFLLRSNLVAWVRFGTAALSELKAWYWEGGIDDMSVDLYLDEEYERMLGMR